MRALIHEGRIVEVAEADFPVHRDMEWVELDVQRDKVGWQYNSTTREVTPPTTREVVLSPIEQKLVDLEARIAALEGAGR